MRAATNPETLHTVTAIEPSLLLRVNYRVIDHLSTQHRDLASFLNITDVTLSRIAQRVRGDALVMIAHDPETEDDHPVGIPASALA